MLNYKTIENQAWSSIINQADFSTVAKPLTVHCPIQPPHSPDWVYVDRALTAKRFRVLRVLDGKHPDTLGIRQRHEMIYVQFALDEPAFLPDYHYSAISYTDELVPAVQVDYLAWDLYYRFNYYCQHVNGSQSLLWITGEVRNEGDAPQLATVRAQVNIQRELELCDYHYVPFYWDNSKWRFDSVINLADTALLHGNRVVGRVDPADFACEWEWRKEFKEADYNTKFGCSKPYFVHPQHRLPEVRQVVKLTRELAPGETGTFHLALLMDYEKVSAEDLAVMEAASQNTVAQAMQQNFAEVFTDAPARLEYSVNNLSRAFTAMQVGIRQMLVQFPGCDDLMPTQGGSTERHFVWVWEAMCMLRPLLKCGHGEAVRKALDFIFNLQDGGTPPYGRFSSLQGAVGTTSVRWANSTGSALALAADCCRYAEDAEFCERYWPKMKAAADWIVGEISATRKNDQDGKRPLTYGFMPFARATDGDVGYVFSFTDAFSYLGLLSFTRLAESLNRPEASFYLAQVRQYQADVIHTIRRLARADGFIPRLIETGDPEEKISRKFNYIGGLINCAYVGLFEGDDEASALFQKYLDYYEQHIARGPFLGPMDRDVMYIGMPEWMAQDVYLRGGQWKKAYLCLQAFLCGMTPDTMQIQERIHLRNGAYTPWQPNGSNCGRGLDMITKSIYFPVADGEAVVLGAVPFAHLLENGRTALDNLRVPGGKIAVEAVKSAADRVVLTIKGDSLAAMPTKVRFPAHLKVEAVSHAEAIADDCFALAADCRGAVFHLAEANSTV